MQYCLQTADQVVKDGLVKVRYPQLLGNLEGLLAAWSPKNAMKFLEAEHDVLSVSPKNPGFQDVGAATILKKHNIARIF